VSILYKGDKFMDTIKYYDDILNEEHKVVRRGYDVDDEIAFKGDGYKKLLEAKEIVTFLLDHKFRVKQATMFVANHYMLNERQRLVLARGCGKTSDVAKRKAKMLKPEDLKGKEVFIDGFNAIIPLESMLSDSVLIQCADGAIRDLANLKGSYRIIDKTQSAIRLILQKLQNYGVAKATFYLDKPISNSGRLKSYINAIARDYAIEVDVELHDGVDKLLYDKENVISGDCIVLDKAISWYPLYADIVEDYGKTHNVWLLDMTN
jgi:hypothetical protein